jgi:hypothetical protein
MKKFGKRLSDTIFGAFALVLFLSPFMIFPRQALGASATLSLSPASGSFTAGHTFDIQVILNTGGAKVVGTDIYINYPKDILALEDIVNGTIFGQYVGKQINNGAGTASLSGLATSVDVLFSGTGTFATLKFKGLKQGTANVTFTFTPGTRNDSNVADNETKTDILSSVTNGTYTITGGVGGTGGGATTNSGSGGTPTSGGGLMTAGVDAPTMIFLAGGFLITILGFFTFKWFFQ